MLLEGCDSERLYKILVSPSTSVHSPSLVLPMCASLDSNVCGHRVEAYSSVCSNKVCSDNVVCENSDGAFCAKFGIQYSMSNKSIIFCTGAFNKLSTNKMGVSMENSSIYDIDLSSKEHVVTEPLAGSGTALTSSISVSSLIYHQRLGHYSPRTLKHILQSGLTCSDKVDKSQLSPTCKIGKSHKLPFNPTKGVYNAPFQLLQVGIWQPPPVRSNCSRYYISFVDDYSRYTWLYFFDNKSEAASVFKSFQLFAE